ncbi:MAG: hypothetical protein GTO45_01055, partial [Candidatus Aminicenantes bacterium]|nr:hypothetical protein [Candidatus Aminicenantes bacterium]NIM77355.1 hypothetical protein [Candidatus Aminicenantes bacterium]NIN16653.1 hypothetical protein [Candidatus Aminicenantes bacterium]NIN40511.1 hypothetical protein [Candidatus Aminicenantes bacterium]NIN83331.1 hypothetical protein [Candidatus Aminicenantes bacterium]
MSKKRKKKKKQHIDPYDVLEGRVNITSHELIRLIHRVNPTNESLDAKKESERYKIKARLQSLLIRNFYDGLLVEQPDPENPQMVSLKLQYFDDDACHALLPELDPDARSWAQRQIDEAASQGGADTGEPPAAGLHRQSSGSLAAFGNIHESDTAADKKEYSPNELINWGRQALEEYDYETCEDYFYRAFIMSRGSIEAALTILEFFVDHLAAYEKAIALMDSLSASAKKDEDVKVLLALAAVRLGNIDQALDYLGRALHPRASEVYLLGARHFVTRGNVDRAKELQGVLKSFELDELQPEIDRLENDIRKLCLKSLKPVEQEMVFAWQQGEQDKAVKLAQQLLVEWPQNKDARRICNEFAQQQRTDKLHSLLRRADEAHSKAEFIKEAGLLERAMALGNADDKLRERFKQVQQAAKLQQDEAEITETIKLWTAGRKKESLLRCVALSEKQRREVINRNQDEHFTWLSRIISAQSSLKPQKMVEAVLALGESKEILQKGGDPRPVVSGLQLHIKVLHSVPEAQDILHRAQEMSEALESEKAKELLKKAEDLAAVEDFQSARECIDQVKVDQLDEDNRKIFADINGKLKRLESIHTMKKRYISEADRGNHFSSRDIALKLAGILEPDTASHWRKKVAYHSSQINKEWCLVTGNIEGLHPCYSSYGLVWVADDANACLLPDGRHVLLVSAHDRWVFLRTFCIPEQKFKQGIMLRAPAAMSFPRIQLAGNEIWTAGLNGHVIVLTLDPPDILSWHDFSDFVKDDNILEDVCVFPKRGYLWLNTRNIEARGEEICEVINMEQRRVERQFKLKGHPTVINTGGDCRIIIQDYVSKSIQMFSEQGKTIGTFSLATEGLVDAAAMHPNGSDYVLLPFKAPDDSFFQEPTPGDQYEEENDDFLLTLEKVPDVEGTYRPFIIDDSHGEAMHSIHTALDDGVIFVYFGSDIRAESHYYLAAFTPGENGFEKLYQVEAPNKLILAADEFSQKAAAINIGRGGSQAVILGRDKPVFADNTGDPGFNLSLPSFDAFMTCNTPTGARNAAALAFMAQIKDCSPRAFDDLVLRMKRPGYNDPDKIAAFINALERLLYTDLAKEMKTWFQEKYPDHPLALIELATDALQEQKWQTVISLLEKVSFTPLDEGTACHICHLLGMGLFARGDIERALETWEAGAAYEGGRCDLDPYITYAKIALMAPKKRKKR